MFIEHGAMPASMTIVGLTISALSFWGRWGSHKVKATNLRLDSSTTSQHLKCAEIAPEASSIVKDIRKI